MSRFTMIVRHPGTTPTVLKDACWSRVFHGALVVARTDGAQECWAAGQWTSYSTTPPTRPDPADATAVEVPHRAGPDRMPSPADLARAIAGGLS